MTLTALFNLPVAFIVASASAVIAAESTGPPPLSSIGQVSPPDVQLALFPQPRRVAPRDGSFRFTTGTQIQAPPSLVQIAEQLRRALGPSTGLPLSITSRGARSRVLLALDPSLHSRLGDEGYRLTVDMHEVVIRAAKPAGVFYGTQTLRQLFPAASFRRASVSDTRASWSIPAVQIEDSPRFGWRGSLLDSARHFLPREHIFKHLDLMALHKLNVLHWHLTDDQGWRIEIKRYPKLTSVGAWRKDSEVEPALPRRKDGSPAERMFRGKAHGGFYSQEDVREVVRYAAERFITVLPEINMPGHARAALAAYPELGNTGRAMDVSTYWGVHEEIFNTDDATIRFLQNVLEEVLTLFPSRFIHVGGDEVVKREWQESERAQARMKALGLRNEHELQAWFIQQMDTWLTQHGRRLIGWDEILEGGIAPGAAIMSWQSEAPGIAAAKMGHDVVMTPQRPLYFDHDETPQANDSPVRPSHYPLEQVLAWDPIPKALTEKEAKHVLGAQAQLWSEHMPNSRQLEYMAWPRLIALSEVVWTPLASREDWTRFQARLAIHLSRLRALDVIYRPRQDAEKALMTIP